MNDPVFTSRLSLMRISSTYFISPLKDSMIDRFCLEILPHIHHKIRSLNVESTYMKRILLVGNYPKLTRLGFYNIELDQIERLYSDLDETQIKNIFQNQISSLIVTIRYNKNNQFKEDSLTIICQHIFTVFRNLRYLRFSDFSSNTIYRRFSFFQQVSPSFSSSTLMELHINVSNLDDCLSILDGRFNQLRRFDVNITAVYPWTKFDNKEFLVNLKCFSMTLVCEIDHYDDFIAPLLHRMINLEELSLFFEANCERFIDGNQLKKDIFSRMPQLDKFSFNIRSRIRIADQIYLLTNDDIQRTFIHIGNNQITCCIDYFPNEGKGQCHIYSYPYTMKYYNGITNSFSGGLFICVEEISLFDERPFEHEFFLKIAQAFPFLKSLTLSNLAPQNHKRLSELNVKEGNFNVVKYPYLTHLHLGIVHDDYVEQFLFDNKTYLPANIYLSIYYTSLQNVTQNFTRDETRINCAKLRHLQIYYDIYQLFNQIQLHEHINEYFPNAKIS